MSISKVSTLTSGVVAIARNVNENDQEMLDIKIIKASSDHHENILVVDVESEKVSNYDELVKSISDLGFGVVISNVFSEIFIATAISYGVVTIKVSTVFLEKIMNESKKLDVKLFIDLKGQEVMIIDSGEKEFFEMSEYDKESIENSNEDLDNLCSLWDEIGNSNQIEELVDYMGE